LISLLHGGGQEFKLRSGTVNVASVVAISKSAEIQFSQKSKNGDHMNSLSKYLKEQMNENFANVLFNGPQNENRLPNIVSFSLPFGDSDSLLKFLSKRDIFCSSSSACASGNDEPSHVLIAIGRTSVQAKRTIRISFSKFSTFDEIDSFMEALVAFAKQNKYTHKNQYQYSAKSKDIVPQNEGKKEVDDEEKKSNEIVRKNERKNEKQISNDIVRRIEGKRGLIALPILGISYLVLRFFFGKRGI